MIAAALCSAPSGEALYELAADERARHRGDVEPQPLLIDEGVAGAEFVTILDENCAADRARDRHSVGAQQQREDDLARRDGLRDPTIRANRCEIGKNQVALTAIAENRQEVRDDAVDRFVNPRQVEHRQIGGDLERGPPVSLLQEKAQRLGDQPAGLPNPFDDIDEAEEQHKPADWAALAEHG